MIANVHAARLGLVPSLFQDRVREEPLYLVSQLVDPEARCIEFLSIGCAKSIKMHNAFGIVLIQTYGSQTAYGGVSPGHARDGKVDVWRRGNLCPGTVFRPDSGGPAVL